MNTQPFVKRVMLTHLILAAIVLAYIGLRSTMMEGVQIGMPIDVLVIWYFLLILDFVIIVPLDTANLPYPIFALAILISGTLFWGGISWLLLKAICELKRK